MIQILRTDSENPDFIELVRLLDADLAKRDGKDNAFYAQFNKVDTIKYVVIAYENDKPVGCGAIKEYDRDSMQGPGKRIVLQKMYFRNRKKAAGSN